jgi:hypothetical protein
MQPGKKIKKIMKTMGKDETYANTIKKDKHHGE